MPRNPGRGSRCGSQRERRFRSAGLGLPRVWRVFVAAPDDRQSTSFFERHHSKGSTTFFTSSPFIKVTEATGFPARSTVGSISTAR